MLATVNSRGQVTVPKLIRDQLNIARGTRLEFTLSENGSISVRALNRSTLSIVGVLKRPARAAVAIEQMTDAVAKAAAQRDARITRRSFGS
jgi:antitoxin PrlF